MSQPFPGKPAFNCYQALHEMEAYLDAETSAWMRTSVDSHLTDCVDCQGAFEFHHELKAAISAKCKTDEVPPGLQQRILNCFGPDFLT
jgi:mycothiol system anti-sigma-R factor